MAKRIKTNQELMNRVIKMLPEGITADAIASAEVDYYSGEFGGYWVYLTTGYTCPTMGCHTIHEYTLAELADMVGSIETIENDFDGYTKEENTMNETTNTTTNTNAQEGKAMFEELTKEFLQDIESERAKTAFYVINGYFATWAEEHRNDPDRGIKAYSTDLRWNQYTRGEITREKAIELATKRMNKEFDKRKDAGLAKIQQAENAPDINEIFVNIDWVRSSTWGMNPHAYAETRNARTYGTASGCGYDKESSAIAQAFNADWSILRILYTLKEQGLREGKTDESKTACTGHDNRDIIGYGAGYSVLPYFEGGVGASCFWAILRKAGFEVHGSHGKKFDGYTLTR